MSLFNTIFFDEMFVCPSISISTLEVVKKIDPEIGELFIYDNDYLNKYHSIVNRLIHLSQREELPQESFKGAIRFCVASTAVSVVTVAAAFFTQDPVVIAGSTFVSFITGSLVDYFSGKIASMDFDEKYQNLIERYHIGSALITPFLSIPGTYRLMNRVTNIQQEIQKLQAEMDSLQSAILKNKIGLRDCINKFSKKICTVIDERIKECSQEILIQKKYGSSFFGPDVQSLTSQIEDYTTARNEFERISGFYSNFSFTNLIRAVYPRNRARRLSI